MRSDAATAMGLGVTVPMRSRSTSVALLLGTAAVAARARAGEVDRRWVARPIVLAPYALQTNVGLSVARRPAADATGESSARVGTGASFEATIGLPLVSELGVRVGVRASDAAIATAADRFARPFDRATNDLGPARASNSELRWRVSLADFDGAALAFEARVVIARNAATHTDVTPGFPVRIRVADRVRIDTGLYAPFRRDPDARFGFDAPIDVFVQLGAAFVGPWSGIRWQRLDDGSSRVDVGAGLGGGVTVGVLDLRAQAGTFRVNDAASARTMGGGISLSVTTP